MIESLKKVVQNRIFQHLVFWVLSFYAIGSYFSISNEIKTIDYIYSFFFHLPLLFLVYLNLSISLPYFLAKERYVYYLLLSLASIAAAYLIHQLVFDFMIPMLPTDYYMVSFTEVNVLISIFLFYLVITTLIKLSKSWYKLQESQKEKLRLELNSLKMQINPHFLFNSLNSIYSLARKKSDIAPEVILELSNLLRYMIYEVSDEKVPLEKEMEVIHNYVKLQKLRIEENSRVEFDVAVENDQQLIAPLLFIPLIENSFKHGINGELDENYIDIKLKSTEDELEFVMENSKADSERDKDAKYGGIGLKNVKKRLGLIYGNNAHMSVNENEKSFKVVIKLKWND